MEQHIKVALIGGTGKSGKYLTQELLKRGYHIRLLHRHPADVVMPHPLLEVVQGDARDGVIISKLLSGCAAVMSTLGQPKGEASIFSTATANILAAMQQHGINRYLVTTGLNVDAKDDEKTSATLAGTAYMKQHYPLTTTDKQLEYDLLVRSNSDWTLIRLPLIEQTDERKTTVVNLHDCPGNSISATDLADFMIQQLNDTAYIRQAPFIANN